MLSGWYGGGGGGVVVNGIKPDNLTGRGDGFGGGGYIGSGYPGCVLIET